MADDEDPTPDEVRRMWDEASPFAVPYVTGNVRSLPGPRTWAAPVRVTWNILVLGPEDNGG